MPKTPRSATLPILDILSRECPFAWLLPTISYQNLVGSSLDRRYATRTGLL